MIFAVVTTTSLLIYDTQFPYPLVRINGCHLATINDVAWSSDGQTLIFCSSDGYVSFVRFDPNELGMTYYYHCFHYLISFIWIYFNLFNFNNLGKPIPIEDVPIEVKQAFPNIYLPNQVLEQSQSTTSTTPIISNESLKRPFEENNNNSNNNNNNVSISQSQETSSSNTTTSNKNDEISNHKKKKRIIPITDSLNLNTLNQTQTQLSQIVEQDNQHPQQDSSTKSFGIDSSSVIDLTEIPSITTIIIKDNVKSIGDGSKVKAKKRITPIVGEIKPPQTSSASSSSSSLFPTSL